MEGIAWFPDPSQGGGGPASLACFWCRALRGPERGEQAARSARRKLVADYERSWLREHGRPDLAGRVRWTAREDGDGLGYDVRSYGLDGHERYIEVKTTRLGAETPFYITSAELDFARRHPGQYALYRVYDVLCEPRFFTLEGDIGEVLELTAMTYSAQIATAASASPRERRDSQQAGARAAIPAGNDARRPNRGSSGRSWEPRHEVAAGRRDEVSGSHQLMSNSLPSGSFMATA